MSISKIYLTAEGKTFLKSSHGKILPYSFEQARNEQSIAQTKAKVISKHKISKIPKVWVNPNVT
ncbi:hypothetical protein [Shouchella clausii]|uniref:hypothetical protein n=1 Tax=Shouchella clausii TaxID=79880 RepID=UPI001C72FC7D|nr:hypothetical protein [Shouchella clausii]MBX0320167.1 hypothetical protein [Shouchella clausii]